MAYENSMSENLAKDLWVRHKDIAIKSQYSPFIITMGAGNQPVETFEGYLYQDMHYLAAYCDASKLAAQYATNAKAKERLEHVGNSKQRYLDGVLPNFKDVGLEYKGYLNVPKREATQRYIDFLFTAARTQVDVYAITALTPCLRLYNYMFGMVKQALTDEQLEANKYKRWIEDNSTEDPEPRMLRTLLNAIRNENLINELTKDEQSQEVLDEIDRFYKEGLERELEFNLSQRVYGIEVVVPLTNKLQGLNFPIVANFDLSCKNSENNLGSLRDYEQKIANALVQMVSPIQPLDNGCFKQLLNFIGFWRNKYKKEKIAPSGDILEAAFVLVAELEKNSFPKNVSFGQFDAQSGCIRLLLETLREDLYAKAHLISSYWSDDSIESALLKANLADKISHAGNKGSVESSIDKFEAFKNILQIKDKEGKNLSLYIGNSVGDLLSLREANIGVIYGLNEQLTQVMDHFLVSSVPLFKGLVQKQMKYKGKASLSPLELNPSVIYTSTYWAELEAYILGSERETKTFRNKI